MNYSYGYSIAKQGELRLLDMAAAVKMTVWLSTFSTASASLPLFPEQGDFWLSMVFCGVVNRMWGKCGKLFANKFQAGF